MTVNVEKNGETAVVFVEGRLDTVTAPELESSLKDLYDSVKNLVFDFEKLEYISSAGLRVVLGAEKIMKGKGSMVVRNVNDTIMEVFEITGFSDILNIEAK